MYLLLISCNNGRSLLTQFKRDNYFKTLEDNVVAESNRLLAEHGVDKSEINSINFKEIYDV
jgi:hypothetical protein